jgi:poly(hydroxyalkanoate) granule-associated protein
MVKKVSKGGSAAKSQATGNASPLAGAIKESAQQIWLAGLGAFSKAQEEGGKAFETLVKEGMSIQRKTQAVAEERISEATSRVSSMANDIQNKAAGQWDKLESLFEERVAKALGKLGVPSARDVDALMERIDALNQQVLKLGGVGVSAAKPARKAAARKPAAKKATAKAAARRAPARKAAAKKSA